MIPTAELNFLLIPFDLEVIYLVNLPALWGERLWVGQVQGEGPILLDIRKTLNVSVSEHA